MKTIGLDLGTTSIGACVWDSDLERVIELETQVHGATLSAREPFAKLQDARGIAKLAEAIVDRLVARYDDIEAIGITGQMHGIVYVDEQGEMVSPLYTWQDGRAGASYRDGMTYSAALSAALGQTVPTGYGLATHFYHVVQGQVPRTAAKLCTLADAVALLLTRTASPILDPSMAASLGGFDVMALSFRDAALERAGIDCSILPRCSNVGRPLGHFRGIPVYPAIGDNQASYFGAVGNRDHCVLINVGTGAQLSVRVDVGETAPGWEWRPFPGGGGLLVGATLAGGQAYALLASYFRQVIDMFGFQPPASLYAAMDKALTIAEQAGRTESTLRLRPTFYGTRDDEAEKARMDNLTADNFTPVDFMIATLDGVVEELYGYWAALPQNIRSRVWRIVGAGNGLRNNPHLARRVERRFGMRLLWSQEREEAAVGAARHASAAASRRHANGAG
ncbi:hypothetical protein Alches_24030 [Alicyclobacillus hesperidum subsp. aegles]|uniref:sedoheptulokinase n=1 Tax=Alicyclobacillus hesperidum TaxID=89784 RepID=UPI0007193F5C|nr:FGGY family carbohydrate kinase [Alicyclobacillus hesperidum]KRW91504.1 hypothetical protein SD51_08425 [Alicyclobacillus tengchongensis]GLG02362.1 hypothetical protein Alches_24030 [Alicyclobacillus hesperidum subsp. aegles]